MGRPPRTETGPSPSIAIVKQALADQGMRQAELAEATGLSKDHISRILLGKVAFPKSRDTLQAMAQALGLDPLVFLEYRRQLSVLPESTRRLAAHLRQAGISQAEFIRRIPAYSEGHLQLILRGGTPFPKDPKTIELFAEAAGADPFMFPEYMPLGEWRDRVIQAAQRALDPADAGVFTHLWSKIERQFQALQAEEAHFEDRLLAHFLDRHFGGKRAGEDPELDDALGYLPPLSQYQPEVKRILEAMHARQMPLRALASAAGEAEEALGAVLRGQMRLKDPALARKLCHVLGIEGGPL